MNRAQRRILNEPAVASAFEVLANELSGSDLRSLLLAVASERASRVEPAGALRQLQLDRFCEPSDLDAVALATVGARAIELADDDYFDPVQLSPLAPFGASSAFSAVPQNNVVTTMRLCDVVSDPTNALALVAAARRRLLRDPSETTRLCAVQRVVRAQQFDAPGSFPHFSLLGLVAVGRDRGSRRFEVEELTQQLRTIVRVITELQPTGTVRIGVSDNSGRRDEALSIVEKLSSIADTELAPQRTESADYYPNLCANVSWHSQGTRVDIADAGVTTWASELAADKKERLVISGLSIDRLVMLMPRRDGDRREQKRMGR